MPNLTAQIIPVRLSTSGQPLLCLLGDLLDLVNKMHFHEKAPIPFPHIRLVQKAVQRSRTVTISEESPTIWDLWHDLELQVELIFEWGFEKCFGILMRCRSKAFEDCLADTVMVVAIVSF